MNVQSIFLAASGAGLLVLVFIDIAWTAISLNNAGPLSRFVPRLVWTPLRVAGRLAGRPGLLGVAGPLSLVLCFVIWVGGSWLGWAAILAALPVSGTGGFVEALATAGYALSSLGARPADLDSPWTGVLLALMAMNGLTLVTLGLSYVISVVGAVIDGRSFAMIIAPNGLTAEEILARAWHRGDFDQLESAMQSYIPRVANYVESRRAYPLIEYFWSHSERTAIGPAIARLAEIWLITSFLVREEARPHPAYRDQLGALIDEVLEEVPRAERKEDAPPPPAPCRAVLEDAGIPLVPAADAERALETCHKRRCVLHDWLAFLGWEWTVSGRDAAETSRWADATRGGAVH